jgi:hypothetical protein
MSKLWLWLICLFLAGCASDAGFEAGSSGGLAPRPDLGAAAVTGFIRREGTSVRFSADPSHPGETFQLDVHALDGSRLGTFSTDSQGRFSASGLPGGLVLIDIRSQPGGPILASLPITVVTGLQVLAGRNYPVALEQAKRTVVDLSQGNGAAFLTSNPLPAGTQILAELGPQRLTTLAEDSWLAYLDPTPQALFAHDVQFLIISATTGEQTILPGSSWPVVNGVRFWYSPRQVVDGSGNPSPEVALVPQVTPKQDSELPQISPKTVGNQGVFGLLVRGWDQEDLARGNGRIRDLLARSGVPASHIRELNLARLSRPEAIAKIRQGLQELSQQMVATDHPSLIVNLVSHGAAIPDPNSTDENPLPQLSVLTLEPKDPDGNYTGFIASNWADFLLASAACRIYVINDVCAGGLFNVKLAELLEAGGRESVLYSGGTGRELSSATDTGWLFTQAEPLFTYLVSRYAQIVDGQLVGLTSGNQMIPELRAIRTPRLTQHPQVLRVVPPIPCDPSPVFTSFSPGSGRAGSLISITGRFFAPGAEVFFANNQKATIESTVNGDIGSVTLEVRVPDGATTGKLRVVNPDGDSVESSQIFTLETDAFPKPVRLRFNVGQPFESTYSATVDQSGHALSIRLINPGNPAGDRRRLAGLIDSQSRFVVMDFRRNYATAPADLGVHPGQLGLVLTGGLTIGPNFIDALFSHVRINDSASGNDDFDSRLALDGGEGPDAELRAGGQDLLPQRVGGEYQETPEGGPPNPVELATLEVKGAALTFRLHSGPRQLAGTVGSDGRCEFTFWQDFPGTVWLGQMTSGGTLTGVVKGRFLSPVSSFQFTPKATVTPLGPDPLLQ